MFNWYRLINLAAIVLAIAGLSLLETVPAAWQPMAVILYGVMGGFHAINLWEERKNPWFVKRRS